jgi:hypothetical protein
VGTAGVTEAVEVPGALLAPGALEVLGVLMALGGRLPTAGVPGWRVMTLRRVRQLSGRADIMAPCRADILTAGATSVPRARDVRAVGGAAARGAGYLGPE